MTPQNTEQFLNGRLPSSQLEIELVDLCKAKDERIAELEKDIETDYKIVKDAEMELFRITKNMYKRIHEDKS